MVGAGIGLVILGYALLYSGVSNISTGGKGWGFFQSLVNKGTNTGTTGLASFVSDITPQGNSGADTPKPDKPVKGTQPV